MSSSYEKDEFTITDVGVLAAAVVIMTSVLWIFRYVINICVIEVCILGDLSSLKKICCCLCCCISRSNDGDDRVRGPGPWSGRAALALQRLGAFHDPVAYLYSEEMDEENRNKLLDLIAKNEVSLSRP